MGRIDLDKSIGILKPSLLKEWSGLNGNLTPYEVSYGSKRKVWWRCSNNHEWEASVKSRYGGSGCPYCAGKKVCLGNSLFFNNEHLSSEWDYDKNYLGPKDVTSFSAKKVWWKCEVGHSYEATVANRSSGWNCPYCSGRLATKTNNLYVLNPVLSAEWSDKNVVSVHKVTSCSGRQVWWLCKSCKSEWKARISDRHNGSGCPYCSGKKVNSTNCLYHVNPKIASEWDYKKNKLTPYDVTSGTQKKAWWVCPNNHEYFSSIKNRCNGSRCPHCTKVVLDDGSICDSLVEAYYYISLKTKNIGLKHHPFIQMGKHTCDFYVYHDNLYIEVTGYSEKWKHWDTYHKNILKKKRHVEGVLCSQFKFVKMYLTNSQKKVVEGRML